MARYLLDTNVLLRAANKASAQHTVTATALNNLATSGNDLTVASQVLVEFWSVGTRPVEVNGLGWPIEQVEKEVDKILDRFVMLMESEAIFQEWLRLVKAHRVVGKKSHDARLAAFCKIERLDCLTFNTDDFKRFGIVAVSPDEILAGP